MPRTCDRCDPPDATEADIDPPPGRSDGAILPAHFRRLQRENSRLCTAIASAVVQLAAIDGRAGQDVEMLVGCVREDLEAALEPEKGAHDGP